MSLFEAGEPPRHIPVFGSDEVADVTGAGDTVIATLAVMLACGLGWHDAMVQANRAGAVVVAKFDTATVSYDELAAA